jgi:serine/tyrosine/threonine adenylyltransferase
MSVLGLTIDYGPYGWLDDFAPNWTPNTTDRHGRRYRYAHQPSIAHWNLVRFAESLLPLIERPEPLEAALGEYENTLRTTLREMLLAKLGLPPGSAKSDTDPDSLTELPAFGIDTGDALLDDLGGVLQVAETDMTLFFRKLANVSAEREALSATDAQLIAPLREAYYGADGPSQEAGARMAAWLRRYVARTLDGGDTHEARVARMNGTNPKYVLRNYIAQLAIDGVEQRDFSIVRELLEVLSRPYDEQPGKERYALPRPDWARQRPGCSMLSCSS